MVGIGSARAVAFPVFDLHRQFNAGPAPDRYLLLIDFGRERAALYVDSIPLLIVINDDDEEVIGGNEYIDNNMLSFVKKVYRKDFICLDFDPEQEISEMMDSNPIGLIASSLIDDYKTEINDLIEIAEVGKLQGIVDICKTAIEYCNDSQQNSIQDLSTVSFILENFPQRLLERLSFPSQRSLLTN